MIRRETAGALALKAASDSTDYDALELGEALTQDIARELMVRAHADRDIIDEDEFFVGYVIAGDPLIKNVMRRKFFSLIHLPSPRPNQTVFLYNKPLDQFTKRLWTLPNWVSMAYLSEATWVEPKYQNMKAWCDAFYGLNFWDYIRKQHNITHLSESEYLNANREKLIQAGCKEIKSPVSDSFDFSKVATYKVIDSEQTRFN